MRTRPPRRLESHPLTRLDRGAPTTLDFDGKSLEAYEGETVAAALYAAGRYTLSRSMRYHRPRGLYCAMGGCTHCFLRIDGVPNQRACQAPCRPGTLAHGQNAWPTLRRDLFSLSDRAFPKYLDAHTAFARPGWLRRAYMPIVRRMAGFGHVPGSPVKQVFLKQVIEPDILVVGAGAAGLAAADAASAAGVSVALVDDGALVGGRLRHQPTPFHATRPEAPRTDGKEWADQAAEHLRRRGVTLHTGTRVFGTYDGTWAAAGPARLLETRPKRVILAPGALDAPLGVPGDERPGVLLHTAAARLLNRHGILPRCPILIHGATRDGILLARDLLACGATVTVTDEEANAPQAILDDARRLGLDLRLGHRLAYVAGNAAAKAAIYETTRGRRRLPCGALVAAHHRLLLSELPQQAGCRLRVDAANGVLPQVGPTLETSVAGLYVAGAAAASPDPWTSVLQGRLAGSAAAASLRPDDAETRRRLDAALAGAPAPLEAFA